jgi:hypothetical protein
MIPSRRRDNAMDADMMGRLIDIRGGFLHPAHAGIQWIEYRGDLAYRMIVRHSLIEAE